MGTYKPKIHIQVKLALDGQRLVALPPGQEYVECNHLIAEARTIARDQLRPPFTNVCKTCLGHVL